MNNQPELADLATGDADAIEVSIINGWPGFEIDVPFLREVAARTLAEEGVTAAKIGVALLDDSAVHALNRRYLEHDYETDVLSFLLESNADGTRIEGEIAISLETAERVAAEYDWRPADETVLYLVHGLLHLTGHDDLDSAGRQAMRARERDILAIWNLNPRYNTPPQPAGGDSADSRSRCESCRGAQT